MAEGSTINPFGSGSGYTPDLLAQFLGRVVPWATQSPPEGYINIHADGGPFKGGGHAFASMEEYGELQSFANYLNRVSAQVFFCLSQQDRFKELNKQGRRKAARGRKFARLAKAFVLDLDVKPGGYPSQKAALLAVLPFLDSHGLKAGFIVNSGRGVHVYIVLDQPIPVHVWDPLASQWIEAAKRAGIKFDVGVSRNPATLLRLPGSFNRKDPNNPLPVSVLSTGPDTALAAFETAMRPYPATPGVRPAVSGRPTLDPAIFPQRRPITSGADYARVQADLDHVRVVTSVDLLRASCPVVADSEARGGDGDREPLWFELAKLCHYVQGGRDYFHDLSSDDERYDEGAVDLKYDQVQKDGWPSCKAIEQSSPDAAAICKTCAFYNNTQVGQKPSPIHFAMRALPGAPAAAMPLQTAAAPIPAQVNGHAFATSYLPQVATPIFVQRLAHTPYVLDMQHYITTANGEKRVFSTVIKDIEITWPVSTNGTKEETFLFTVPMGTQGDHDHQVAISAGAFNSASTASALLKGGIWFDDFILVKKFMSDWQSMIRQRLEAHAETRLGWVHNDGNIVGFAYGGYIFDANGQRSTGSAGPERVTPRGSLALWRQAANFFTGKGCIEMEVLIATAFASPLVIFTGADSLIVFGRSAGTGMGKTASLECSASTWGTRQLVDVQATINRVDHNMALMNNLPTYYDELVPSSRKAAGSSARFSQLIHGVSAGREKGRMTRGSNEMEQRMSRGMFVAASNFSLTEVASSNDTNALAARVLEIEMSSAIKRLGIKLSQVGEVKKMLENNCGQGGLVYSEYLGKNHVAVEQAVKNAIEYFQSTLKLGSDVERYWIPAAATLFVGASISKKLGLIDFDIMSMQKFLLNLLSKQHASVKEMNLDPTDPEVQMTRLRNFLNSSRAWVTTDTLPGHGGNRTAACQLKGNYEHARAWGGFIVRHAYVDKVILVSEAKLLEWCLKQEIDFRQLRRALIEHGYCIKPKAKRSLVAGTQLAAASPEAVLLFDLTLTCNLNLVVEDDHV